ncbi:MAG: glycogen-binding domain-containing protein [Gemmatimonadaceae bacterium]
MADNSDENAMAEDAEFAERIASRLRSPEHAHPSFEKRLMEKVRAEGSALYPQSAIAARPWWRTEREFRIPPLAGLALAAGIAGIIAVSGIAIGSRITRVAPATASAGAAKIRDTVQVVRFVFVDPSAKRVELVGDFNEWAKGTTQLSHSGAPGVWTVSVPLSPGRHEYAFIINGSRWVADPFAPKSSDDFGTESSVIRVGTPANSAT